MAAITNTLIEAGMSSRGGWNEAQMNILGLSLQGIKKGWKLAVEGNEISQANYEKFLALKDKHIRKFAQNDNPRLFWRTIMANSCTVKMRIELFEGGEQFQCKTCFHNKTKNCSVAQEGMACIYWWQPNSKIVGTAYKEYQTHYRGDAQNGRR